MRCKGYNKLLLQNVARTQKSCGVTRKCRNKDRLDLDLLRPHVLAPTSTALTSRATSARSATAATSSPRRAAACSPPLGRRSPCRP